MEYGLLVFAIAAVIVSIVVALGAVVDDTYKGTCDEFQAEAKTTATC